MKTIKNDSNLKVHVSDWLTAWDMSFYIVEFEELVSEVSESISEDYLLDQEINIDDIDLLEYTRPFEKSAVQRLFEDQFKATYSDELLEELGYRVNESNGTISKWQEDKIAGLSNGGYFFDGNFDESECYKKQAMFHILQKKLGMDYGTEIEKFI